MRTHPNAPALALRAIGMHPKYTGYGYGIAILEITQKSPEQVYRLNRGVYPRIMEQFGCTRAALDRNLRFAIERTWENGNQAMLSRLFGSFGTNWIPTNTEFIRVMTDFILHGSMEDLPISLPHVLHPYANPFTPASAGQGGLHPSSI